MKYLLLIPFIFLFALPAHAAISFDNAANSSTGTTNTVTLAYTTAGTNRILFCGVQSDVTTNPTTSITYAGIAMTLVNGLHDTTGNGGFVALYYLTNPANGNNNVVENNNTASIDLDCSSYDGAAQTGQPDNEATNLQGTAGTTFAQTIVTNANNSWGIVFSQDSHGTVTNSSNATLRTNSSSNVGLWDSNGPKTPAGSLTVTAQISGTASTWAGIIASFAPAGPAVTFAPWQFTDF